eukprot:1740867-Rhodomonas_salina.1
MHLLGRRRTRRGSSARRTREEGGLGGAGGAETLTHTETAREGRSKVARSREWGPRQEGREEAGSSGLLGWLLKRGTCWLDGWGKGGN